jgi:hypothetical protein
MVTVVMGLGVLAMGGGAYVNGHSMSAVAHVFVGLIGLA